MPSKAVVKNDGDKVQHSKLCGWPDGLLLNARYVLNRVGVVVLPLVKKHKTALQNDKFKKC